MFGQILVLKKILFITVMMVSLIDIEILMEIILIQNF